jgi:hypothetical protein
MTTRPCAGPAPGVPCPTRQLIPAQPGSKTAARCGHCRTQHDRQRGTTTTRGYGTAHQQLRANLIADYQPSDPCWRCRLPLGPDPSALDLGHTDDRLGYKGLEHAACGRGHRQPVG